MSIFEIREFVNESGEIVSSGLVDVGEEMKQADELIKRMEQISEASTSSSADQPEKESKLLNFDMDRIRKLAEDLKVSNSEGPPLDEHMKFVRELAEVNESTDPNTEDTFDDDWFTELETIERSGINFPSLPKVSLDKSERAVPKTAPSVKTGPHPQNLKATSTGPCINDSGWRKGFLSAPKASKPNRKVAFKDTSGSNGGEESNTSLASTFSKVEDVKTVTPDIDSFKTNDTIKKSDAKGIVDPKRPKAFSGSIIEKFP